MAYTKSTALMLSKGESASFTPVRAAIVSTRNGEKVVLNDDQDRALWLPAAAVDKLLDMGILDPADGQGKFEGTGASVKVTDQGKGRMPTLEAGASNAPVTSARPNTPAPIERSATYHRPEVTWAQLTQRMEYAFRATKVVSEQFPGLIDGDDDIEQFVKVTLSLFIEAGRVNATGKPPESFATMPAVLQDDQDDLPF